MGRFFSSKNMANNLKIFGLPVPNEGKSLRLITIFCCSYTKILEKNVHFISM